jgi:hypothetical protein
MLLRGYSGYSDASWFLRALRAVPVIASAALIGGMVGGFAVLAIDTALTWAPSSQARPEARSDNQTSVNHPDVNQSSANQSSANQANANQANANQANANRSNTDQLRALDQRATKPARVVGGAIPDPSAGMSEPPPVPQQQRSSASAQPQISSQLLAPKPLGPSTELVTQLPPQTGIATPSVAQTQGQPAIQGTHLPSVQTQNAAPAVQQRWPDALSRAHQNPSTATTTQQQTTPAIEQSTSDSNRAAGPGDQNNPIGSRQSRYNRRHTMVSTNGVSTNGLRNDGGNEASIVASPSRGQDARTYNRLYDSYGNPRQPLYGDTRGDQDDSAYRLDTRRYGRTAGYRIRPRVIMREQLEELQQQPPPQPFWGGGYFRY